MTPTLPITLDNLYDWFPAPHVENPFAGDPWWQFQAVGTMAAMQYMRLLPDTAERQQALIELRRSLDTGLLRLQAPPDEEITRRRAQTLAPYCPSPYAVVSAMLDLAEVGPGDTLVDLGSGDGRIVLTAAERGATAYGIDIDQRFVAESAERAASQPRAHFLHGDLMDMPWENLQPTVVTCYLLTSSMATLREKFTRLPRGTRIISHAFPLPDWPYVRSVVVDDVPVYLWVV